MKNFIRIIKAAIVVCAAALLCMIFYDEGKQVYDGYMKELSGNESFQGEDVEVYIPENTSAKDIAKILQKKGLIKYPSAFVSRLKNSSFRGSLKSGEYVLNTGMTTLEMMEVLSPVIKADEPIQTLVIPEGFTVDLIAARCEKQGICKKDEFISAVKSVTTSSFPYLEEVPAGSNVRYKLEGFLFPATYNIYESTTAESLVKQMLNAFESYYTQEMKDRANELGLSTYEVITMASMVEREARVDEERAIIAGVFNNRLDAGMLLQVDPTFLYPITNGMYDKEVSTYADTEFDSPYNTYKYTGLPVGPICNPGVACMKAVLYPEDHSYYYYHVKDADMGTHIFTETYEEHLDTQ